MPKKVLRLVALFLLGFMFPAYSLAATTTPTILNYQGVLKDSGGVPITTAQSFRFSIWSDSNYDTPADFDGAGAIPPAAPGYSGYQEVQTVTPDTNGFFQLQIGSVTPIPDFNIASHLFLQVEVKPSASANTAYEELDFDGIANTTDRQPIGTIPYASNADFIDNAEIGTSAGDIAVLGPGGVFDPSVLPDGTNANTFTIDADDTGGDVTLQFGTTLNETLTWDSANLEFVLSDDLNIAGGITASGSVTFNGSLTSNGIVTLGDGGDSFTINSSTWDISSAGVASGFTGITSTGWINFVSASSFKPPQGLTDPATCSLGEVFFNTTTTGLKVCTATNTWSSVNLDKAQTVTVAKSGGNFTTINAAVASITDASPIKQYVIDVYPGVYTESPINLPDFVSIVGLESVTIVALDPTGTLIDGGLGSVVDNLNLSGASGVGGICYRSTNSSTISNVSFADCETGLLVSGAAVSVGGLNLTATSGSFTDVIRVESSARFQAANILIAPTGLTSKGLNVVGAGTVVDVTTLAVLSPAVTDGIYVNGGANVTLSNSTIQNTVNGIHVGPTGASILRGTGGIVEDSSQYTLYIESAATKVYYDALQTQKEKFNINPDALVTITFNNTTAGEEGKNVFGRLSVGRPESSEDSYFGEGDPYTNGMLVYTFNGATYTNVSTAAADITTTFTFPGVATNNAIYVSSSRRQDDGDFVRFEGINYTTASTAASLGAGEIVEEFWNGTSWVVFPKLCIHRTLLYRYDNHCFDRPDSDEINFFDNSVPLTWIKNDPVTLGTDQYWIRIRIASTILVSPVFQQFKIQPNSYNITHNGSSIFLGDSRVTNNIISSPDQIFFASGSNAPSNSSFNVGTGNPFSEDRVRSSFRGNGVNLDELTGSVVLPKGLDTSTTMNARIHWKKANNAAGNVQWHIDYAVIGPKNVPIVNGSNIATAPRTTGEDLSTIPVFTTSTVVEGGTNSNETFESVFTPGIDVSDHYQGDKLLMRLYRDAADPDDTYTGDAIITGFELNGAFWSLGEAH